MGALEITITIIQLLACLAIIVVVLMQSGKSAGLSGAIGGGSGDTFLSKNKSKTWDARMARMTKWVAVVFIVLTLVLDFVVK